jgi:hypothetical protein
MIDWQTIEIQILRDLGEVLQALFLCNLHRINGSNSIFPTSFLPRDRLLEVSRRKDGQSSGFCPSWSSENVHQHLNLSPECVSCFEGVYFEGFSKSASSSSLDLIDLFRRYVAFCSLLACFCMAAGRCWRSRSQKSFRKCLWLPD